MDRHVLLFLGIRSLLQIEDIKHLEYAVDRLAQHVADLGGKPPDEEMLKCFRSILMADQADKENWD